MELEGRGLVLQEGLPIFFPLMDHCHSRDSGSLGYGGFLNLLFPTGFAPAGGGPTGLPTEGVIGSDACWKTWFSLNILLLLARTYWNAKVLLSLRCNLAFILATAICFSS